MKYFIILLSMLLVGCGKEFESDYRYYGPFRVKKEKRVSVESSAHTNIVVRIPTDEEIYDRQRERRISEMQEAFERAIRNTGLDKKGFPMGSTTANEAHGQFIRTNFSKTVTLNQVYGTNSIYIDDMPEFYKESLKAVRAYTNSCYIP